MQQIQTSHLTNHPHTHTHTLPQNKHTHTHTHTHTTRSSQEFMDALNTRHFEHAESASERATLLEVCRDPSVGLDAGTVSIYTSNIQRRKM